MKTLPLTKLMRQHSVNGKQIVHLSSHTTVCAEDLLHYHTALVLLQESAKGVRMSGILPYYHPNQLCNHMEKNMSIAPIVPLSKWQPKWSGNETIYSSICTSATSAHLQRSPPQVREYEQLWGREDVNLLYTMNSGHTTHVTIYKPPWSYVHILVDTCASDPFPNTPDKCPQVSLGSVYIPCGTV